MGRARVEGVVVVFDGEVVVGGGGGGWKRDGRSVVQASQQR